MPRRSATDICNYKIYKIACLDTNITDCYVGSTADLKQRKTQHKSCCNNPHSKDYNMNVYKFIRKNGGWDNFKVYVLEELECNKYQAELREEHLRNELNATLNVKMVIFDGTKEEYIKKYREDNKEQISEKNKQYRQNHKEEITKLQKQYFQKNKEEHKKRCKQYRQEHKEEIAEKKKQYRQEHKEEINEKQKQYRQENKEYMKEYDKQYYLDNKEEITEKKKEKIECPICNFVIRRDNLSRHQKGLNCKPVKGAVKC